MKSEININGISVETFLARLVNDNVVDKMQLQTLQDEVEQTGQDIIAVLIKSQIVSEAVINSYLENVDIKSIQLNHIAIDPTLARKIPKEDAISYCIIAFYENEKEVRLAVANPSDINNLGYLSNYFDGKEIVSYIAKQVDILAAIDKFYEYNFQIGDIIKELEISAGIEFLDVDYQSPIIRLVDAILFDAVHKGTSDIHIQPDSNFIRVRYRIDGVLHNQFTFDLKFYQSIVVRIKIIGGMNIAESIRPQDGSIQTSIMAKKIDFRVSLMPTIFGEGIVIRVLDKNDDISSLKKFNFSKENDNKLRQILKKPEGVLVITGPTGSGKTTTLYAMMSEIASPGINMITIEDPVEYHLPLAKQVNVNHAAGISFASGLRAILRQDPDVIFVGEMRDEETAITAMRASMTGHKVFSTLHTNDAISAINRLLDLQISKYIIASSINGIVAQRLVRVLCKDCKKLYIMEDKEYLRYKIKKTKQVSIYKAFGCKKCHNIGYLGRIAIVEVLAFDKEIKAMIEDGFTEHQMLQSLKETKKFIPMQIDAIKKVMLGITSFDEINRVIDMSDYV